MNFLEKTKQEAEKSIAEGGRGNGAILVKNNEIIALARDRTRQTGNPMATAEFECMRLAGRRNDQSELVLYSSRPPDMMVAGLLIQFGVGALAIGGKATQSPALNLLQEKKVPVLSAADGSSLLSDSHVNDLSTQSDLLHEPSRSDREFLEEAFKEAHAGYDQGGVPVGAVMVRDGVIVARGRNKRVQEANPVLHGETDCLKNAGLMKDYSDIEIFTTLSPCMMCTGAILHFGMQRVIVGEDQNFPGNIDYLRKRGVDVVLIDDSQCKNLMARFIEERPDIWYEDIAGRDTI